MTTTGCHLCERAMDELLSMPELGGFKLDAIDIAFDDDLISRYAERIPVLRVGAGEFCWPLDRPALRAALQDARASRDG